jgi:hypothetical protein
MKDGALPEPVLEYGKSLTWLTSIQIWRVKYILFSVWLTICSILEAFLIFKIGYSLSCDLSTGRHCGHAPETLSMLLIPRLQD